MDAVVDVSPRLQLLNLKERENAKVIVQLSQGKELRVLFRRFSSTELFPLQQLSHALAFFIIQWPPSGRPRKVSFYAPASLDWGVTF